MDLVDLMERPPVVEVRVPETGTQAHTLLLAFQRGERHTMLSALQKYQIMAASQRCTDLRKLGWPIETKMISTPTGKHVAEWSLPDAYIRRAA